MCMYNSYIIPVWPLHILVIRTETVLALLGEEDCSCWLIEVILGQRRKVAFAKTYPKSYRNSSETVINMVLPVALESPA